METNQWRGVKCPKCEAFLTPFFDGDTTIHSLEWVDENGNLHFYEVEECPHCGHRWDRIMWLEDVDAEE